MKIGHLHHQIKQYTWDTFLNLELRIILNCSKKTDRGCDVIFNQDWK